MKLFLASILLLIPIVSFASNSNLKITEIMYDLPGIDADLEWIEICNTGVEDIIIKTGLTGGWRFVDADGNHKLNIPTKGSNILKTNDCAILASNGDEFLKTHPDFSGNLIDTVMNLRNTADKITLPLKISDENSIILDEILYSDSWGGNGTGYSIEKINLSESNASNNWKESSILSGTPGYFINTSQQPAATPKEEVQPSQTSTQTTQTAPPAPSAPQTVQPDQTTYTETQNIQPAQNQTSEILQTPIQTNQTQQQNTAGQTATNPPINSIPAESPINVATLNQTASQTIQNLNQEIDNKNTETPEPLPTKSGTNQNLNAGIADSIQNSSINLNQSALENLENNFLEKSGYKEESPNKKSEPQPNFMIYFLAVGIALLCASGIIYLSKIII